MPIKQNLPGRDLSEPTTVSLLVVAALISIAPVMLDVGRAFGWHFGQATTVQGGVEVLLLWLALALAASLPSRRWRTLLVTIVSAIYLRRHHVDTPLLVALFYVEGLIAAGNLLLGERTQAVGEGSMHEVAAFLLGVNAAGLLIWTASALGFGRPIELSIATFGVLSASCLIVRQKLLAFRLVDLWLEPTRSRSEIWLGAAILTWFLCLCARTNNVVDYDSLWYALRLPQVLVGEHSAFDPLGLVSPVYYFPKLYESLMLPLATFDDFSFQLCFSIAVLGVVAILAGEFLGRVGLSTSYCLLGAAALITIPTFSNMALAAKPDLFASMLLLGAALSAWSVGQGADLRQLGWIFALVLLAFCSKLNTAPYGAAIFGSSLLVGLFSNRTTESGHTTGCNSVLPPQAAPVAVAMSVPLAALVTARTWLLTGVPTIGPEQLVATWKALGMHIRPPAGTIQWTARADWAGMPSLIVDLLFRPSRLEHIIITWVGNAWAILSTVGVILWLGGARSKRAPIWVWWPTILVGLWLALGTRFLTRGGDGNYFLLPLALGTLLGLAWLGGMIHAARTRKVLLSVMAAVSLWQAAYSFVSAAWSQPGTRTLDLEFARSPLDTQGAREASLQHFGLAEIDRYLRTQGRDVRVVGAWAGDESALHWLSARTEGLATVSYSYPQFVSDAAGFCYFLRLSKIKYLIVPMNEGSLRRGNLPAGVAELLAGFAWQRAIVVGGQRAALLGVDSIPCRNFAGAGRGPVR